LAFRLGSAFLAWERLSGSGAPFWLGSAFPPEGGRVVAGKGFGDFETGHRGARPNH
jgi:hypothetical protein